MKERILKIRENILEVLSDGVPCCPRMLAGQTCVHDTDSAFSLLPGSAWGGGVHPQEHVYVRVYLGDYKHS